MAKLKVLCVTKRYADIHSWRNQMESPKIAWHQPVTGEVELLGCTNEVRFNGRIYRLLWIRKGLCGKALTIGILNHEEPPYTAWDLYTNVPIPDHSGNNWPSVEEVEAEAAVTKPDCW